MNERQYLKRVFGTTLHIFGNIFHLIFSLPFLVLTILGNSIISVFALLFYYLEHDVNTKVTALIDCFWWSFATATTVGYGDITPATLGGKILGIFLMLVGTALFATYTALFARAILGEDFEIRPRGHHK